jgi:saccharopine dehydrogenase (NAD+, L-lysine forming)
LCPTFRAMKIGIVKEGKVPIDKRVPLTPEQCAVLMQKYACEVVVQPSTIRAITDEEYVSAGVSLQEDLTDCDVLLGVKEVPVSDLIAEKTYFFFSHTYKQQPYNAKLLRTCVERNIRLIDYELLTKNGRRVVAFGRFAGLVGAYSGLRGWGEKFDQFSLTPAFECHDLADMWSQFKGVTFPSDLRIVLTGKGRVANGAVETLEAAGISSCSPEEFLAGAPGPVWTQLDAEEYYRKSNGEPYSKQDLYRDPTDFESAFMDYAAVATMYIAGHYYDARAPYIFTREDAASDAFNVRYVADISCDIDGPVASTLQPSTIADPFYGYDPKSATVVDHKASDAIGVMAVDNLPCELPRDASLSFGKDLLTHVLPALFDGDADGVLSRATECQQGALTEDFSYLQSYIDLP